MRIHNLTPYLAVTKVTSRHPPAPEMTLVVRGTFALRHGQRLELVEGDPDLDQGFLCGEIFAEGDDDREGAPLYPGDFADFKVNAEVMFVGACHPPGASVNQCPVKIALGDWHKTLQVFGPRHFKPTGGISKPEPFASIPVDYAHAFGGTDYPQNPVGRGRAGEELPNVELAYPLVTSRRDEIEPASFAPLSSQWPARIEKRGKKYGADYAKKRAPFYSTDFDWRYFSAAPADQQLEGYLRGDETLTLVNLHRDHPQLEATLPGQRVRAFCLDDREQAREIAMSLDTVFVDGEADEVRLTWRGLTPVREIDLVDVVALLIATEPLETEPKPRDDYIEQLRAFADDPVGMKAFEQAVAEGDVAKMAEAGVDMMGPQGEELRPALALLSAAPDEPAGDVPDNPVSDMLADELGSIAQGPQADIKRALADVIAIEIPPSQGSANAGAADADEALKQADLAGKIERAAAEAKADKDEPGPGGAAPGATVHIPIGAKLKKAKANVADSREQLEALADEVEAAGHDFPRDKLEALDEVDAMLSDERLAEIDPSLAYDTVEPDELGPDQNLAGCDLTGRDLRGVDLSRANLTHAILNGADLSDAMLAGAILRGAALCGARLDGADLTEADLSEANATGAQAAGVTLCRARLKQSVWVDADLSGADASGVEAEQTLFRGVKARRARFVGATLRHCIFSKVDFAGARFDEAELHGCTLEGCSAIEASLRDARFDRSSLSEATLTGANLRGLRGVKAVFLDAELSGADLRLAVLPGAHFSGSTMADAKLFGADLRRSRLVRCNLTGLQAGRCNLMGANLGRSDLSGADFTDANLFGAKLLGAMGKDCNFQGANLKRAKLPPT